VVVVALALVAGLPAGCGKEEFQDRTAVVTLDGRRSTYVLDDGTCGLDGETAFVLGRSEGGSVLQAVVGVDPDDPGRTVPDASGITVSDGAVDLAAFGAEAWERRGRIDPAPGTVERAAIRGARIQLRGTAVPLDASGAVTDPEAAPVEITLDARCDAED